MAKEKRKRGDEVKRGDDDTALKNWPISATARERVWLYAGKTGKPESVIVDWIICASEELRRYVVSDRGVAVTPCPAPDLGDGSNDAAPTLPISEALPPAPLESPAPAPGKGRGPARPRREAG